MPSKLVLKFNSVPTENEYIRLKTGYADNALTETFKPVRYAAYQSKITAGNVSDTLSSFADAFNADYNSLSLFSVVLNFPDSEIEITHPNYNFFLSGNIDNNSAAIQVLTLGNTPDATPINITDVSFIAATDICNDVKAQITTDVLATIVRVNGSEQINPNANNPFSFDWIRGAYISLEVENSEGETTSQNIQLPKSLSANNVSVSVVNSPSGATVQIVVDEADGLTMTYSLDDVTYQSSNTYPNLTADTYTAYIKDQFGCTVTFEFTVEDFETGGEVGVRVPYVELPSKSNSIRYKLLEAWGFKTDENTLSNESDFKKPFTEIQQFLNSDKIKTQIRSNFNDIKVWVIRENGDEEPIVNEQKSTYLGLKDKRDAIKYQYEDKTGVYFTSGKTYDYDTGADLSTYALNGALPYWGNVGQYIFLDGAWYEVENVIWDDDVRADVLIISQNYTGNPTSVIVSTVYNQEDYEEWEFLINMVNYLDETIQVRIDKEDSSFDTVTFLSEKLNIKATQEHTVEIRYKHDKNTDINYYYGIEHLIRAIKAKRNPKKDDESETHKTDSKTVLLNGKVHELDEFEFEPVTTEIMRKMVIAFHHPILTLDGVGYVKSESGSVEVEGPLEDSNLFSIKATLIKTGKGFTTKGVSTGGTTIDVPKLAGDGTGNFVIY